MLTIQWRKYRPGRPSPAQAAIVRLLLLAGTITMLVPFAWMLCTALKDSRTIQNQPQRWAPTMPLLVNHADWALDYLYATTADFHDVLLQNFDQPDFRQPPALCRQGTGALRLAVDFSRQPSFQRTIHLNPAALPHADVSMLAFWLRGDGSGHRLRLRVHTQTTIYAAVADLPVQFEGYKEVYCFFRPEQFDPLGREVIQLRPASRPAGPAHADYVPLASLRSIDLQILPESTAARIVQHWTYSFRKAWASMPFGRFYLNSLFVALAVTLGQVLTSSLAAYAFARLNFPGRDKLFFAYLATMMIPPAVMIVPTFILMKLLGWFDTYRALILPGLFSAYGTFLLRQFFKSLPTDLEDAARIDGCGKLRVWLHVIMPLSKPALATLATFTFLGAWGAFQWPLFATQSMHMKVLPIGLSAFQDKFSVEYNLLMAASLIVMVPTLLLFLFNQRFFTQGIQLSGIKE
jgi:multiple sugar transport system permease protein